MAMQERTEGPGAPTPPSDDSEKKIAGIHRSTAILGLITALVTLGGIIAGLFAGKTASQNNDLNASLSSAQAANSSLSRAVAGANSTIASLQAQLSASPTTVTGSPPTPSVAPNSGSAAAVNLADPQGQNLITNRYNIDSATQVPINGKTYPFGYVDGSCFCASRSLDFNLSRAYSLFTGRIGARDDSSPGSQAQIQVIADGVTLLSKSVALGTSYDVRVSVKNALRLRLITIAKSGVIAAFGDPTVSP